MNNQNLVRLLWTGLGIFALVHMVINIIDYLGPNEFYHFTWKLKQIVASAFAAVVTIFNATNIGRGGTYIRISVVVISLLFGFYGIVWLLIGGDGHVLWRIGFPVFLIILCVYTLIVQKSFARQSE